MSVRLSSMRIGVVLGAILAVALGIVLQSLLLGVSARDPAALLGV